MNARIRDLTGQTFGYLTAIEPTEARIHKKVVWRCVCNCGRKTCLQTIFTVSRNLLRGNIKSCVKQQHNQQIHPAIRINFGLTRHSAYVRNYVFELTLEQFISIIRQSCRYCGANNDIKRITNSNNQRWGLRANGIDRWNNNLGYVVENCVPCCARCNRAKFTMSGYEYINHCRNVTKNNE